MKGTIIKGIGGYYYVDVNKVVYECRARGVFRNDNIKPVVGDKVRILILDNKNKKGSIEDILPRKNAFIRPPVANIDNIVIVISATIPKVDFMLLDKLLVIYQMEGIKPIICINKIDEGKKNGTSIHKIYDTSKFKVIMVSAKENIGVDELECTIKDATTIFTGQSGVGKSSIINKIIKQDMFDTGPLSKKISRGKNTTRHVELVEIDRGGYILDSPGFSSIKMDEIDVGQLQYYYPEFIDYIPDCKFTGCSHIREVECNVRKALENGFINAERYNRYVDIYNELLNKKKY